MAAACFSAGGPSPDHQLLQVLPLHVLLGDEMNAVHAADVVDLYDIGVDQRGRRLRFVMEAPHIGLVLGQLAFEHLDGHLPAQRALLGQVNLGHRAAPQPPQQAEIAQLAAR